MSERAPTSAKDALGAARRLVVKVGSAILVEGERVRGVFLETLAADIAALRSRGVEVTVVTSGAIALGRGRLGLSGPLRLDEKQAASAAGQALLVQAWQRAFDPHGVAVAQLLLTLDDTENRRRYLNARATFATLHELGALPLVNENDTIATAEIRYGDNDRLAAHAAHIAGADVLVILSDIDGVYTGDPRSDPGARHLAVIERVTGDIERAAAGPNAAAGVGSGGMASKIAAAKIAGLAGVATIIASGAGEHALRRIGEGAAATLILPSATRDSARRQWIAGRLKPEGQLVVDAGAARALAAGSSLLPAGVTRVVGDFGRGDAVTVADEAGRILGQGLAAFDSAEIAKIAGRRSDDIESILGYRRRPAVIERNDLIVYGASR